MSIQFFTSLLANIGRHTEETFVKKYPDSVLILEPFAESAAEALGETIVAAPGTGRPKPSAPKGERPESTDWQRSAGQFLHPEARVALLKEGSHSQIDGIVTAGRGTKSDIVLPDSSLSRTHVLFHRRDDHWLIEDHNSRNGTWLNETQLEPYERVRLPVGAGLRLGLAVVGRYLDPPRLWRFCLLMKKLSLGGLK